MKNIGTYIRTFLQELGKGVEDLGSSIRESGLFAHLAFLWCLVWGVIGVFITVILIFG